MIQRNTIAITLLLAAPAVVYATGDSSESNKSTTSETKMITHVPDNTNTEFEQKLNASKNALTPSNQFTPKSKKQQEQLQSYAAHSTSTWKDYTGISLLTGMFARTTQQQQKQNDNTNNAESKQITTIDEQKSTSGQSWLASLTGIFSSKSESNSIEMTTQSSNSNNDDNNNS